MKESGQVAGAVVRSPREGLQMKPARAKIQQGLMIVAAWLLLFGATGCRREAGKSYFREAIRHLDDNQALLAVPGF